jgi:MoxR-like ATPase
MAQPKDFQIETAKRIAYLLIHGRSRVLLADEVGLGKTIVARQVIELIR